MAGLQAEHIASKTNRGEEYFENEGVCGSFCERDDGLKKQRLLRVGSQQVKRMAMIDKSEIGKALSLYDKFLFWEYSEREIQFLSAELVIPRVTRYGSLNDIIRLFVIFPSDTIYEVVNKDRELDVTEKTFLNFVYFNRASSNQDYQESKEFD